MGPDGLRDGAPHAHPPPPVGVRGVVDAGVMAVAVQEGPLQGAVAAEVLLPEQHPVGEAVQGLPAISESPAGWIKGKNEWERRRP